MSINNVEIVPQDDFKKTLANLSWYWEKLTDLNGRIYYSNHLEKKTQWHHPITGEIGKKIIVGSTELK